VLAGWKRLLMDVRDAMAAQAARMTARCGGAGFPMPEDFAQIVMTRLLETYGEPGLREYPRRQLFAMAYRTLHRAVIDEVRRHREVLVGVDSEGHHALPDHPDSKPGPDHRASVREELSVVGFCMEKLKDIERRFAVACLESDSAPEAQALCGWPPGGPDNACHARNRLFRLIVNCVQERQRAVSGL
jgi:DNA-directed RNA polymerase specialized sigma24 family protein